MVQTRVQFSFLAVLVYLNICAGRPAFAAEGSLGSRKPAVRQVVYNEASRMKVLAEQARQIGNDFYPRIVALLGGSTSGIPRQFDIVFKERLTVAGMGPTGGYTHGATIYLNADWLTVNQAEPEDCERNPENLELFLVHELTHLAQPYKAAAPRFWEEGIADYVRYRLGSTNGWSCPQCAARYPHYTAGYWCAGAFLLQLDGIYGVGLIRQLHQELVQGSYADSFFEKATGKNLEVLWKEFQVTGYFTPIAADFNDFHTQMGYVDGKAPSDYEERFKVFVGRPGMAITVDAGKFLEDLISQGKLPGCVKGEHDRMVFAMPQGFSAGEYPASRTFHGQKKCDPSIYFYRVSRLSSESHWKIDQAWGTNPGGTVATNYLSGR